MMLTKTCLYSSGVGIELAQTAAKVKSLARHAKKIVECDWLGISCGSRRHILFDGFHGMETRPFNEWVCLEQP